MKRTIMLIALLLLAAGTAGCWNLREPNELAFILGAGIDLTKDGRFEISSQIAIPAGIQGGSDGGGGSDKKSFYVASATGKNIMDAGQNMQIKLSRTLFYAHRQTILIGQRMAERGISNYLDMFVRNPKSEMRSLILVVKGGQAKDALEIEPIFDPYISMTFSRVQQSVGYKPYYYRQFLADALSEGNDPLVPAVALMPSRRYVNSGSAILKKNDNLKLKGFLNEMETFQAYWMKGRQKSFIFTSFVPQGKGEVSLKMESLTRQIRIRPGKPMRVAVRLRGSGTVVENNSSLNPSKAPDLKLIDRHFGQAVETSVRELIDKAQKRYKTDFLGFGEYVHRQHPLQWKTMKRNWDRTFPELQVSVQVELNVKDPGQTNSNLTNTP
ncbi:Ger(x)C family spore germination protein [Paenibacillus humicola]|uniref:Ger(x)C family spore germination protein n=1 Tax=Paenibacillus humicola TaxID=3110540 RepID=UPI00237BE9BF|nr:Ger(x)C family spore germination protein [Paenibacillus humicola]